MILRNVADTKPCCGEPPMLRRFLLLTALLLANAVAPAAALADPPAREEPPPTPNTIRQAVTKALPLIQKGGAGHMAQRTCFACHNQAIPLLAMTTARTRGFPIDEAEIHKHVQFIVTFL